MTTLRCKPQPLGKRPTLFIKEDSQAFSQYSKLCPWNIRRYPIILTKEEKDKIDEEMPGSYHSSIEYGTDPKKNIIIFALNIGIYAQINL